MLNEMTYLGQVRALRKVALEGLKAFPLKPRVVDFIHHGENTTFKVKDTRGRKFLCRVHRQGYHSDAAIREELAWLHRLGKTDIIAPVPVKSKNGSFLAKVDFPEEGKKRNVTVFHWVEGRRIYKSMNESRMKQIGELTAKLHTHTKNYKVKHRHYWNANGLAGRKPFMGPMDNLVGLNKKQQETLNEARKIVYRRLKNFEKKNPERMGFIHGDLHFGNLFIHGGIICPIDFDDSGYGFHMYDLAVTEISLEHGIKHGDFSRKEYNKLCEAFRERYSDFHNLGQKELNNLDHMKLARRFIGSQWLNIRADNPRLKKFAPKYARETVRIMRKALKL